MSSKNYETIIVGAGISGLACARQLDKHNKDFLVISKDIGGRILESEDGSANYGAFFVCSDYKNVLKYVTLKSRIRLRDFCFHEKETNYVLFEARLTPYLFQFMKVENMLFKFRKKLRYLRKISENISQKKAIENDSFLHELYMQDATDLVKRHKIEKGTEKYLSKALYSTTFSKVHEMNAFIFLQFLIPLITPIYTFKFEKEKMIKSFKDRINEGAVTDIKYSKNQYTVKSNIGSFNAKNIVLATDINWSKQFAGIKKTNKPVSTNMLNIRGAPKEFISRRKYQLFSPDSNVQAIADLEDGNYLFYYKDKQPNLNGFFNNPKVIAHKHWNPAGTINGHKLIESNRGNNMYLVGDYNIAGLEEAYITGIYSANQIIKR